MADRDQSQFTQKQGEGDSHAAAASAPSAAANVESFPSATPSAPAFDASSDTPRADPSADQVRFHPVDRFAGAAHPSSAVKDLHSARLLGDGCLPPHVQSSAPGDEPATGLPATLGQYHIIRELGSGGMGSVYLATQQRPQRQVALKVIRPGLLTPRAIRRFEFEAELLARLQHPGIAQIHEAGFFPSPQGQQPYFAMEYIQGCTITQYAQRHGLSIRARLELLVQAADAVHHAHQRGVIHRDLKPANILVRDEPSPAHTPSNLPVVKIVDLGIGRAIDATPPAPAAGAVAATDDTPRPGATGNINLTLSLTRGNTSPHDDQPRLAGTLPYMAPELLWPALAAAVGDAPSAHPSSPAPDRTIHPSADLRIDVYSLGVVAYELLTDRRPYEFASPSVIEAAATLRERQPPRPSALNKQLRGDVEAIVLKALHKRPDDRYQSAADLAADIWRWMNHQPIIARPPSRAYRLRRFVRRNRALVTGLTAAALALVLGLAATTWQAVAARRAEAQAKARFEELREMARWVIFDLDTLVRPLPDSTAVRAEIVARASQTLEHLLADAHGDPELELEVARGYRATAMVKGQPNASNLGQPREALEDFERALAIYRDHAASTTVSADTLDQYARALDQTLPTTMSLGRMDQTLELLQELIDVRQRQASQTPTPFCDQHPLSRAALTTFVLNNFRGRDFDQKQRERLQTMAEALVRRIERLPELNCRTADEHQSLGNALSAVAMTHAIALQYDQAFALFDRADGQFRAAAEMQPNNATIALNHGDIFRHRATVLGQCLRWREAAETHDRALAHYETMRGAVPDHEVDFVVALTLLNQAGAYEEAGDPLAALAIRRRDIDLKWAVFNRDRTNHFHQRHLAQSLIFAAKTAVHSNPPGQDPCESSYQDRLREALSWLSEFDSLTGESIGDQPSAQPRAASPAGPDWEDFLTRAAELRAQAHAALDACATPERRGP